jgi:hypothetical protein
VLAATATAVAIWVVAVPVLGLDLAARPIGGAVQQIGPIPVVVVSLLAGLLGWLVLALLERLTSRAGLIWRVIAGLVLLVSLLGPLAAINLAATGVLLALHLVVGGILILGLPRGRHT